MLDRGRVEVSLEPGVTPEVQGPLQLRLQAAAPSPRIAIDDLTSEPRTVSALIENVFADALFVPTRSSLGGVGDCPPLESSSAVVLAPIATQSTALGTHAFEVTVPPCTRLSIQVVAADDRGIASGPPLNLAIVGEVKGNLDVLGKMVTRLADLEESGEWAADVVVALGDLANSPELVDLTDWREAALQAGLPLVVAIGPDELIAGELVPFHDLFGPSDYTFAVGDVRFFVLDTASSELSESQFAFWERTMSSVSEPIRVALMSTPPFDPAGVRGAGFTNRNQAARLVSLLGENGVDAVFTGGVGTFEEYRVGGIAFYSTGGGGGPIEALSDVDNHFLRVSVDPAAETIEVEVEALD